jgi:uncharacterized protein (TIGR02145 family)
MFTRILICLFAFLFIYFDSNSQGFRKAPSDGEIYVSKLGEKDYKFVTINGVAWLADDLQTKTFNNGELIFHAKSEKDWDEAGRSKIPAWRFQNYDPANAQNYGYEYNWYAVVDSRGIVPEGYRIPSCDDYRDLIKFLGGSDYAAFQLKSKTGWADYCTGGIQRVTCSNCSNWSNEYKRKVPCHKCKDTRKVETNSPQVKHSGNGSNSSGFNAKPNQIGIYNCNYKFGVSPSKTTKNYLGEAAFWTIDERGLSQYASYFYIDNSNNVYFKPEEKSYGYKVRCYFGG